MKEQAVDPISDKRLQISSTF